MTAKDTVRCNKTAIQATLSGDHRLILNKVLENKLITSREYNNLKSINKADVEEHVIELVDKILNKGEDTCRAFLSLLQMDEDIKTTYLELRNINLNATCDLPIPIQASCSHDDYGPSHERKRRKQDEQYDLKSQPVGLCVIINNVNFSDGTRRAGTDKDAQSLAEVFSWLGFRVLMCVDQTRDQIESTLNCISSHSCVTQLQELHMKEFSSCGFTDLHEAPKHGDAFVCCILSHGAKGAVYGVDLKPLSIKQLTRTFNASALSPLSGKPKVFLIQACQGDRSHPGVLLPGLQPDESHSFFIPEEADVLLAMATVEDCRAMRHTVDGSWFVQSVCEQLREACPRGEDFTTILLRVNDEVSQKEAPRQPGAVKQMPEVRFTLRKRLVLTPR